jgi:hypothetical protein
MDWDAKRERQALSHIVALLFLFAALAERSAGLSRLVRAPALWILRRAERVAWEFVTGEAGGDVLVEEFEQDDAGLGEATRLALSFRALASLLAVMAGPARHLVRHQPEDETRESPRRPADVALRVLAPDTS